MQRIYFENPHPFHMYNSAKIDACSKPRQIPKVDLFVITAFNGFKSLTVFTKSFISDAWQRYLMDVNIKELPHLIMSIFTLHNFSEINDEMLSNARL